MTQNDLVLSLQWPTLIETHILNDGVVATVNTSVSTLSLTKLLDGNVTLRICEGRTGVGIDLTPEAAKHFAERLLKVSSRKGESA